MSENAKAGWLIPTEIALTLPTSSVLRRVVTDRQKLGAWAMPESRLFLGVDRYFLEVPFCGDRHPAVVYALDIWPLGAKAEARG